MIPALEVQISPNFTRRESACRCRCGKFGADVELVSLMEDVRLRLRKVELANAVISVHSWYRCREYNNRAVAAGGAGSNDASWHLTGGAVDFSSPGVALEALLTVVVDSVSELMPGRCGIGAYDWGLHLDVRPAAAFWDARSGQGLEV